MAKYVRVGDAKKRTYYVRDAQGNVMAAYSAWMYLGAGIIWDSVALSEQHIYGSSRVGYAQAGLMLYPTVPTNPHALDSCHYLTFEGWKRYEISLVHIQRQGRDDEVKGDENQIGLLGVAV